MRALLPAQYVVIPVSLTISALVSYSAWNFHNVRATSPVYSSRSKVAVWAAGLERSQHCLAPSIRLDVISESDGRFGTNHGPWFGTLKCNQSRILFRFILVLLLPWLIMNLTLMLLSKVNPPVKRRG